METFETIIKNHSEITQSIYDRLLVVTQAVVDNDDPTPESLEALVGMLRELNTNFI